MRHQQFHHLFGALRVPLGQTQVAEVLIAPHQVGRLVLEDCQKGLEAGSVEGFLEVLNGVELDAPLPQ